MSKEMNKIYGALHNTLDKLKAVVRKGKPVPPVNDIYQWFTTISPVEIKTDRSPIIGINPKANEFKAIFFFNDMKVYLFLGSRNTEHRGHPFIFFTTAIEFIDALCPDNYKDAKIIEHLQTNFDIQIP